jgi:PAS domain S-box-containing protein
MAPRPTAHPRSDTGIAPRDLFQIAFEASPAAMLIVRRDGGIVLANSQAANLFAYPLDELVGMNVDDLTPPAVKERHPALRESFFAAPSRRRFGAGRDLSGVRKDGREVPLEIALAPIQLADGPGVLAAIVDIAERRELQARLSQTERLAAVGELAAGVAHEINNPVNTMINCARLALDGDDLVQNCRIIMEEGERIATIVKDLLQFSRDERKQAQSTSWADTVEKTMRLFGENLRRHGIRLEVDVPRELPPVLADPRQLQQVLLNLLINAKDALLQDRNRSDRCIAIRARSLDRTRVQCSVRDNGPGIQPDLLPRIFEPFVTTKRARGGTGLGLSVSRSIVASFGGTLDVETRPLEFADFRIVLPRAD